MTDELAVHRRETGGVRYVDVGQGPVTLFVHGVFTNGRLWRGVVHRLRDHRRCIVVDLPGHGHTPPFGEASLWGLADAVGTVLTDLDLREVHLVGNDTGGAVCQIVMARHENRIASWVLTNCDTEGNTPPRAFTPVTWALRLGLLRVARPVVWWPALAKQILRSGYRRPTRIPDDVVVDYLAPILGNRDAVLFMERLVLSMAPQELGRVRPQLEACQVPTLLVWGTADVFFDLEWAHWLHRLIPGAAGVVEIPGGRLFFPDEFADEFVEALEGHWTAV